MPKVLDIRYTRPRIAADTLTDGLLPPVPSCTDVDTSELDLEIGMVEDDDDDEESGVNPLKCPSEVHVYETGPQDALLQPLTSRTRTSGRWTRRKRLPACIGWLACGRWDRDTDTEKQGRRHRRPLRIVLKSLAIALMLLGLVEFVALVAGLITSFFPSELDSAYSTSRSRASSNSAYQWPTDYTADIQPVQCHSHNDYWRPIPLKSAVRAGCTGVEADVWLFPDQVSDELYVGHSKASLTPERTFRSLYVEPLVEILERQNPNTTLHPQLDNPRNGVYDTAPGQSLVLLIDFKTDGLKLWPVVQDQLQPLRERKYVSYFNGTDVVEGPVTIVVTGNAPFSKVVENAGYRDMFFDAPLELFGTLAPTLQEKSADTVSWTPFDDFYEREYLATYTSEMTASTLAASSKKAHNEGQSQSGAAPKNAAIYTPANSYYASVSFVRSIGPVLPWLRQSQKDKIRRQIIGAHKQGLKVRYWNTPSWPRGLRQYIWRILVEEGVDYLNVDDLRAATRGDWGSPSKRNRWGLSGWIFWR